MRRLFKRVIIILYSSDFPIEYGNGKLTVLFKTRYSLYVTSAFKFRTNGINIIIPVEERQWPSIYLPIQMTSEGMIIENR